MSAPLYARYVPPKKYQAPIQPLAPQETTYKAIHNSTPQLYSRYVPPKGSKHSSEALATSLQPFDISLKTNSIPTTTEDANLHSKKRKREEQSNTHKDRRALIEASSTEHNEDEGATSRQNDPGIKEKKSKKRKSSKAEAVVAPLGHEGEQGQPEGGSPADADSILAKYSVTGGNHRVSLLRSREGRNKANSYDHMDIDPLDNEDEMSVGSADEAREEEEEEEEEDNSPDEERDEINQAGVLAIFEKYRRSTQLADADHEKTIPNATARRAREKKEREVAEDDEPEPELHGLEPLPQPARAPKVAYKPTFDSLPPWLAKPTIISSKASMPFNDLNLSPKILENLVKKGYKNALAVQSGVLPLLLPGPNRHHGDLCVSAPTGSGKTLAYIVPMIESLKRKLVTRLRGIVIVPTRELVAQAREVAEVCAASTGVKIGTAVGNVSLSTEQGILVRKGQRFDPEAAKVMHQEGNKRIKFGYGCDDSLLENVTSMLPGHVPEYSSNVDLIICTPGRLVDHIRSTAGFSLNEVEWLIIDEADKLLDQSFQDWVEILLGALHPVRTNEGARGRERTIIQRKGKHERRRVQKVILSATMTRDLSKLASLKFEWPSLVAIAGEATTDIASSGIFPTLQKETPGQGYELPSSLTEVAVPVGDGSDKPLYLLRILQDILRPREKDQNSGSESDMDSDSSSGPSSSSSSNSVHSHIDKSVDDFMNVLVFTNNNENANRLRHLLSTLYLPFHDTIDTLTKSSATSDGKKTLNAFRSGRIRILIASDRASRGLDVTDLANVINYDMPRSVTSYIHRVGRTARAGRGGKAWTLFTRPEARWFWNSIAGGSEIRRGGRIVERIKVEAEQLNDDKKGRYQEALKRLQSAVQGT